MTVFWHNPNRSTSARTRPTFQSTHEIEAMYARMTSRALAALAVRPMNRSALRLRMAALGNPDGTVGHAAKSGVNSILFTSYKSKNFCGAAGGLCGLTNPQAIKNGCSLYLRRYSMVRSAMWQSPLPSPLPSNTTMRSEYPARLKSCGSAASASAGFPGEFVEGSTMFLPPAPPLLTAGKATVAECEEELKMNRRTLQRDLKLLVEKGLVREIGTGPTDPTKYYQPLL